MSDRLRRRTAAACAVAAALALAGCASADGGSTGPSWQPKPSFSGEGYGPSAQPEQPGGSATPSPGGSNSSSGRSQTQSPVVATHLTAPTAVAIMPDNTALVGERTTGRIVRVQPEPNKPVPTVRVLHGLSTVGGGGLLDLALSPNYAQDNLIFAYVTTPTDNRVVDFTLTGPVTPVLTGIPRGRVDNAGRIAFAANGDLLVATGDAGRPALAQNPRSLAGKVLRVTDIGRPAPGNPVAGSPVYASGFRTAAGLCTTSAVGGGPVFETGARPDEARDPIFELVAGANYGWPAERAGTEQPVAELPTTSRAPGGCAVQQGVLYTTTLDGKALLSAALKDVVAGRQSVGAMSATLRNTYGRLRTVVAAPDGALWLTTSNRDGYGTPVASDERVLRIVPSGGSSSPSPL